MDWTWNLQSQQLLFGVTNPHHDLASGNPCDTPRPLARSFARKLGPQFSVLGRGTLILCLLCFLSFAHHQVQALPLIELKILMIASASTWRSIHFCPVLISSPLANCFGTYARSCFAVVHILAPGKARLLSCRQKLFQAFMEYRDQTVYQCKLRTEFALGTFG